MKHSPSIELSAARRELQAAREECPHWDLESDGGTHDCCVRVERAKRSVRTARKACEAQP